MSGTHAVARDKLNQVPEITVQIFENSDGTVIGGLRFPDEPDTLCDHVPVVSLKVVRAEKQEDSATGLVADELLLLWSGCSGK